MSEMRKLGAFWQHTSKAGNDYYSGNVDADELRSAIVGGETQLFLFNARKSHQKSPDLELFAAPPREREQRPDDSAKRSFREGMRSQSNVDDDIVF